MKLNKKGQALVEFVLVIPIIIFILFATIDIGKIIYTKNGLQSKLDEATELLNNDTEYNEVVNSINNNSTSEVYLNLVYNDNNYVIVKVSSNVKIITPGLNALIGNPYTVVESRKVHYDNKETE